MEELSIDIFEEETILQADPVMIFQVLREYHPLVGIAFPAGEPVPAFNQGTIRDNGRRLEIAMTTITMMTIEGPSQIHTTNRAIVLEVEHLSDEQTLITGKYLPETKPYFDRLWQNMIQVFTASERYDPYKSRDEKIHHMWLKGETDRNIGRIVGLGGDRVKQIRHAKEHGWKKTRKKKTT